MGLLAVFATSFIDVSGADNSLVIFPLLAISLAASAVVAEVCVRAALRLVRGRGMD